jgi:hypothetical protein
MTKEQDKELAEQAEEYAAQNATGDWEVGPAYQDLFNKKFADLIRADEREACAKVCDDDYFSFVAADAIRARGNT